jgi:hypothetical protein
MKTLQGIAAIFVGFMAGVTVIWLLMLFTAFLFPPAGNYAQLAPEIARQQAIENAPLAAYGGMLFAFAFGAFLSGFTAQKIATSPANWHALVAGILLLVAGLLFLKPYPYPIWFLLVSSLTFLPCAALGGWVAKRKRLRNATSVNQ